MASWLEQQSAKLKVGALLLLNTVPSFASGATATFNAFRSPEAIVQTAGNPEDAKKIIDTFLNAVANMPKGNFADAWNSFQRDHAIEANALEHETRLRSNAYGGDLHYILSDMWKHKDGLWNTEYNTAIANAKIAEAQMVADSPKSTTQGQNQTTAGASAAVPLEPQAAYEQFVNTLAKTVLDEKNNVRRLAAAKDAVIDLKATNLEVYDSLLVNAGVTTKLRADNKAAEFVITMVDDENEVELTKLGEQVKGIQQAVAKEHLQEMVEAIGGANAMGVLLGKDIKEIKKAKNQNRMRDATGTIARTAVNTLFNAVLGQAEDVAGRSNAPKVGEAIGNMRDIFERATGTREVGYAQNDVWSEIQNQWNQTESIKDEVARAKAQQRVMLKMEAQMRKDCRDYCRKNNITNADMEKMINEAVKQSKDDLGITAAESTRHDYNSLEGTEQRWSAEFKYPLSNEMLDTLHGLHQQVAITEAAEKAATGEAAYAAIDTTDAARNAFAAQIREFHAEDTAMGSSPRSIRKSAAENTVGFAGVDYGQTRGALDLNQRALDEAAQAGAKVAEFAARTEFAAREETKNHDRTNAGKHAARHQSNKSGASIRMS
jgi:hypothetical protein